MHKMLMYALCSFPGMVTAGECSLCLAGTYQTGSGQQQEEYASLVYELNVCEFNVHMPMTPFLLSCFVEFNIGDWIS
jgi:hypothetical protein